MNNQVKSGVKTTELWAVVLSTVLLAVWPAFPKEAFFAVITWVAGRSAQKAFGLVDPITSKASWQTSEFYIAMAYSIAVTVFPDLPTEALYSVQAWIASRTGIKITQERKQLTK